MQESFDGGEISPLVQGRTSIERYQTSLAECRNYIPTLQGPAIRRPGLYFIGEVKDSATKTHLYHFTFSSTQSYVFELGEEYLRIYDGYSYLLDGFSAIVELATPWGEDDLENLRFAQSLDVVYVACEGYRPRVIYRDATSSSFEILRMGEIDYSLPLIQPQSWMPYLDVNTTTTTITPSATSGTVTLTASANLFESTDVYRSVALKVGSAWHHFEILTYSSATSVTAALRPGSATLSGTGATANWRLGAWSDAADIGWPKCVIIKEGRIIFANCPGLPSTTWFSALDDYLDFNGFELDGTLTSANAFNVKLDSNVLEQIEWLGLDEKGIPVGTSEGEWVLRPRDADLAVSATNIKADPLSNWGSDSVNAAKAGKASLYVEKTRKKLRELTYFYEVDGFRAIDLTELAAHLVQGGVKKIIFQKAPHPIVWAITDDGSLLSMTYQRESTIKAGWAKHPIGGIGDPAGNPPVVEDGTVRVSDDGTTYELWLVIKRYIDGGYVRYVEYMTPFFEESTEHDEAIFYDSCLQLNNSKNITAITKANPAVVTSASHGYSDGDLIRIEDVVGMTELNGRSFTVANSTTDTLELLDEDSTNFTSYVSGGEIREMFVNISGLDHLEGETVSVFGDGVKQADKVVSSGAITVQAAATVLVGYSYKSRIKTLRPNSGSRDGTSMGKTRRIHRLGLLLYRTLGIRIGTSYESMFDVYFNTADDPNTGNPALFSGIATENFDADYDLDNQICIEQDGPHPGTIVALMPQLITQDR